MAQRASTHGRTVTRARRDLNALPPSKLMVVRAPDGTRLHTRVFGPADGYPVVLCHGITCAHRVWTHQIADLAADHRVIAFDHRGHGRSSVPARGGYSLNHLAADLNAVLDATLKPGERAVIAGHSMGGIAIAAWSDRYRHTVAERADAVALINTTTGDLLRELDLLKVPELLAAGRILVARNVIRAVGSLRVPRRIQWTSRMFVAAMAVGSDADPAIGPFVHQLFAETAPAARGGCASMLADSLGSDHLRLNGLTVPTLVIGSEKDRLLPLGQSRRIAGALPNLAGLVELPGGHCAILERPDEVNRHLRALVLSTKREERASS